MKRSKRIAAGFASLAMIASMAMFLPMGANAAATTYSDTISGTKTVKFDKYLVMKKEAAVPEVGFEFTIAKGNAVDAAEGKMEVLAGVGTPKFVIADDAENHKNKLNNVGTDAKAKVTFSSSDTTVPETGKGERTVEFISDTADDEKFAEKSVQIDFSDVKFTEPGIYRYIISEVGATDETSVPGVQNDAIGNRTLDVYVVNDSSATDNALKIDSYVLHTGLEAPERNKQAEAPNEGYVEAGTKLADKSTGFSNAFGTQNLSFGKKVTGNQGSKDKFFKFTVSLTNAKGAIIGVTGDLTKDLTGSDKPNAATAYTCTDINTANSKDEDTALEGQQLKIADNTETVYTFYLQDGQYVKLSGVPVGALYAVTEDAEDYKSTKGTDKVAVAGTPAQGTVGEEGYVAASPDKKYDDDTSGTIGNEDIYTGFTNNRSGVIPTGILLSVAGPAAVGIVVLGGIAYLLVKNARRKAEED